jgi:hypothetical protein
MRELDAVQRRHHDIKEYDVVTAFLKASERIIRIPGDMYRTYHREGVEKIRELIASWRLVVHNERRRLAATAQCALSSA